MDIKCLKHQGLKKISAEEQRQTSRTEKAAVPRGEYEYIYA